jgi:hypothetical protein
MSTMQGVHDLSRMQKKNWIEKTDLLAVNVVVDYVIYVKLHVMYVMNRFVRWITKSLIPIPSLYVLFAKYY